MSLLEQGLPAHFFTRRRAVVTGLAIGVVVVIGFSIESLAKYYLTEPKTAPACYGNVHVAGKQGIPQRGFRDYAGRSIDDRQSSHSPEKTAAAMRECAAQSCPRKAWQEYRSVIFWYLSSRLQHMSNLYRAFGDAGLERARQIYREPLDLQVEQGLRDRYRAGVFRLNDFRQNQAGVLILVLKGSDALRPCGPGEAAPSD